MTQVLFILMKKKKLL